MTNQKSIKALVNMGGKEWTKAAKHRVYLSESVLLKVTGGKVNTKKRDNENPYGSCLCSDPILWSGKVEMSRSSSHVANKFFYEDGIIYCQEQHIGSRGSYSLLNRVGRFSEGVFSPMIFNEVIDHTDKEEFTKLFAESRMVDFIVDGEEVFGNSSTSNDATFKTDLDSLYEFINSALVTDVVVTYVEGNYREYDKLAKESYYKNRLCIRFNTAKYCSTPAELNDYDFIYFSVEGVFEVNEVTAEEAANIVAEFGAGKLEFIGETTIIEEQLKDRCSIGKVLSITLKTGLK